MLKIVYSKHGQGKTTALVNYLSDAAKNSRPLFIVPEQFHFETERKLYNQLGSRKISLVEITSFTKLSQGICTEYGLNKPYSDDTVKLVTMMRAVNEARPALTYYKGKAHSKNFAGDMLSLVSDFKKQGISAEECQVSGEGMLTSKMKDIGRIYQLYDEILYENYSDKLDDIVTAAALAQEHNIFFGRQVFLDGFDGFSGSQLKLLQVMLSSASEVTVSLATDSVPTDTKHYLSANKVVDALLRANRDNAYELIPVSTFPPRSPKTAELYQASDVLNECDWICSRICKLITAEGYNLSDIAVLTRSRSILPPLTASFKKYGLTAFSDMPSPILEKPMIAFMLRILDAVDFRTNEHSFINYIQSGFVRTPISFEQELRRTFSKFRNSSFKLGQADKDNAYSYLESKKGATTRLGRRIISDFCTLSKKFGISGADWEKPITHKNFVHLEPYREIIVGDLTSLGEQMNGKTGDQITSALSDFLINKQALGKTMMAIVNRRSIGFVKGFAMDKSLSDEYRQLWDIMVTVLESVHNALLGYKISLGDYTELLKGVLQNTNIAKPPQVMDAVTIGDLERTRTENIKVVFIADAVNGVFPKRTAQEGEFSADELDELIGMGIELADNRQDRYNRERFITKKALLAPTEKIILTMARNTLSWSAAEPSPAFDELRAQYGCEIQYTEKTPPEFFVWNEATLQSAAARHPDHAGFQELLYKTNPTFAQMLYYPAQNILPLSRDTSKQIFRSKNLSPSAINVLVNCPFRYFCKYGLVISPVEGENGDEPNSLVIGNLIHKCMESLTADFDRFMQMGVDDIKQAVRHTIDDFLQNLPYKDYTSQEMTYLLKGHDEGITRLLISVQEDFSGSRFRIEAREHPFSYTLGDIRIEGRIDRLDSYCENGEKYYRVIDYKSGKDNFSLERAQNGFDLQILLYLFSVEQHGIPSGAFINKANIGQHSSKEVSLQIAPTSQQKNRHWLETHRKSGIQLDTDGFGMAELGIQKEQNKQKSGSKRADFISSEILSSSDYQDLKDTIGNLITDSYKNVTSGIILPNPAEEDSCKYCDYSAICKHSVLFLSGASDDNSDFDENTQGGED